MDTYTYVYARRWILPLSTPISTYYNSILHEYD